MLPRRGMQTLWQDVRYGLRMLSKQPGFALVAVLTLTLGIGANTIVFSLLDTLYWRPLPVPQASRLVHVFGLRRDRPGLRGVSLPAYGDYRRAARSFADLAAHYASAPINFATASESKEINGSVVTPNYFDVLALNPARGRFFRSDDDRDPVAVISHDFWRRQFDSDPLITGKPIVLNGTTFTIVGVAPREFHGVFLGGLAVDVWMPSAMFRVGYRYCDALTDRDCRVAELLGRLEPHAAIADAQRELDVIARQLELAYPETQAGWGVTVVPARGVLVNRSDDQARVPALIGGGVALVLLIACANVAGLLLARAFARRREIAVRAAIGASRRRLVRQLLTESVLLALGGAAGALLLLTWAKDGLLTFYLFNDEGQRAYFTLDPDPLVFGFTFAVTAATAVIFGIVPALHGSRADLLSSLKDSASAHSPRSRARDLLIASQVALSLVLLVGAGLMVRSVAAVYRGPGYDPSHVVLLRLRPSLVAQTPARAKAYHEAVLQRLAALPGVVSASPADRLSLPGWDVEATPVWLPDRPPDREDAAFHAAFNLVGPSYFATLGIPFLAGRDFDARDRRGAPDVAIVNDVLARHFWPSDSAIGQTLVVRGRSCRIIGMVSSAQYLTAAERPHPFVYTDFWQSPTIDERPADSRTHIRVAGSAQAILPAIRRAIADVDRSVPISEDRPLTEWLDYSFRPLRVARLMLACFGGVALFLTAIGIYGVLAVMVAQRAREMAIRVALGATRREVARLVVTHGARLAGTGAAAGLAIAAASASVLGSLLYGVRPFDAVTIASSMMALAIAAAAAMWVPARRAVRVDPMVTLRAE